MRLLRTLVFLAALAIAGCADAHGRFDDSGLVADAGRACGAPPFVICVSDCGVDAGIGPVCTDGIWGCPPGTRDLSMCPPTCHGPPPGPGCVCNGTTWSCESTHCPDGINPWNPMDPANACSREGAMCSSGTTDPCGSALSCECRSGHWNCAVAEPDPVCTCGRQPSEGDRCSMDGASCGECCPTPGGTGWPAMQCVSGHWTSAACPAIECPPIAIECPADTSTWLGTACSAPHVICGDPCCSDAISCEGGVWIRGPEADCDACDEYVCGAGHCRANQTCVSRCGPADGIDYFCAPRAADCMDCSCIPLTSAQRCEMIGGEAHVSEVGFCG